MKTRYQQARKITLIGAVINVILAAAKIFFGIVGKSQALVADGIHSLSDLLSDGLVLVASRYGSQDPDSNHPYGHERIETAATMLLAMLLIFVGGGIMYDAVHNLLFGKMVKPQLYVLWVAMVSVVVKEVLYYYTKRVAERIGSNLVHANAWHHRSDAASSVVVVIGIIGALMGYSYFDTIAAFIVGGMVVNGGWWLGWSSVRELVDTGVDEDKHHLIEQTIQAIPGVKAIHQLRTRSMGSKILVDVHVLVDEELSVSEGHHIALQVHYRLMEEIPAIDVTVHVDPEDDEASPPSLNLPGREALLQQLNSCWRDCTGADEIKKINLHYLSGQVAVEIYLPLTLIQEMKDNRPALETFSVASLTAQYHQAVAEVNGVSKVEVYFVEEK
ncbi:MAG: cation diffusion facilitator family transporter [Gammaproteobacteria bacterium]